MSEQPAGAAVPEWTVGDRMDKARKVARIGVQEMADYLGVARNTVSTWTSGRIMPDIRTLRLWAMRTGVPFEWLAGDQFPRRAWSRKAPTKTPLEFPATLAALALAA